MYGNNRNGSDAPSARGFAAFFAIILAMRFSLAAFPVEAAPFAYVTNGGSSTVSVIDTATNMVVATVPVGAIPSAAAVTPDGKHAYVANASIGSISVSVIDTATNVAVATVPFGMQPFGVAITPDGKHAYVAINAFANTVSVIDTATNTVVATVPVGSGPDGVAVTPDGKHVYIANMLTERQCFGDRHNHQHGGDNDPGGQFPRRGRHHPGWETRLCREYRLP